MIIGAGKAKVFKYFDSRERIEIGVFEDDILIGDVEATFDCDPSYTVETDTYCSIGIVKHSNVKELFKKFPAMKK